MRTRESLHDVGDELKHTTFHLWCNNLTSVPLRRTSWNTRSSKTTLISVFLTASIMISSMTLFDVSSDSSNGVFQWILTSVKPVKIVFNIFFRVHWCSVSSNFAFIRAVPSLFFLYFFLFNIVLIQIKFICRWLDTLYQLGHNYNQIQLFFTNSSRCYKTFFGGNLENLDFLLAETARIGHFRTN